MVFGRGDIFMSVASDNYNKYLIRKEPSFNHVCCVIVPKKEDAKNVLNFLQSRIGYYGYVSIYDLYTIIGAKTDTEDDMMGWTSVDGTIIKPTFDRKEYRLILPRLDYKSEEY